MHLYLATEKATEPKDSPRKFKLQLIPTIGITLAVILLASFLPGSGVLGQGGQPSAAPDKASPDAVDVALGSAFTYQGYSH